MSKSIELIKPYGERLTYVTVEGERVPTSAVDVVDIEEDYRGYDLATFEYKGQTYQSYVVLV